MTRWREFPHVITDEEVTEIQTNPADLQLYVTGEAEADRPEGEAARQREGVHHHAEKDIAVRVHGATEADPEKDGTDHGPSLQGIIVAIGIVVIPSPQKDLKRAIRRVVGEMSDLI